MNPGPGVRRRAPDARLLRCFVILVTAIVLVGIGVPARGAAAGGGGTGGGTVKDSPAVSAPSTLPHRVIAYYFHTTRRCTSCKTIEAYSKEAIEGAFAAQLKDGRLVWAVVNIEVAGNEHFVKDYGLYTKSLVLVNEVRGKPAEWKNLEKVWQLLQDKPKFLRYVQDETRAYLAVPS